MPKNVFHIAADLIINELAPRLKKRGIDVAADSPVSPEDIAELAYLKFQGHITTHDIRKWLDSQFNDGKPASS